MLHEPEHAGDQPVWLDWALQRLAGMAQVA